MRSRARWRSEPSLLRAQAKIRVDMITVETKDDETCDVVVEELPLVQDAFLVLALNTTVIHVLDEHSPLVKRLRSVADGNSDELRKICEYTTFHVAIEFLDVLFYRALVHKSQVYHLSTDDVRFDARFQSKVRQYPES